MRGADAEPPPPAAARTGAMETQWTRDRIWILAGIVVVGAVLRLLAISKPFYIDEIVTITVGSQPLASMAGVMRQIDASPALFPVLLHLWLKISHADAWIRLLPGIFGILAVPAFAAVAARAFGVRAGLAAGAVMAIAPAHVEYALYVRSYSLFTLLAAAHVWLFFAALDDTLPARRRHAVWLVLVTAALLYTHYLALLLFAAETFAALFSWRRARARVFRWAIAGAVGGLFFLPGVPLLLFNAGVDSARNPDRPEPGSIVRVVPNMVAQLSVGQQALGFGDPITRKITLAAAAIVFPTIWLLGVIRVWPWKARHVIQLSIIAWLPLILYLVLERRLVAVRFFLPFTVGYVALLGAGLASLKRRGAAILAVAAIGTICAVPLWRFESTYDWSYDHRRVAAAIERESRPGDLLLFVHPFEPLFYRWYLDDRLPMQGMPFTALVDQPGYVIKPPLLELPQAQMRVREAFLAHPRVWLVGQSPRSFASDARVESQLRSWMDATYERLADLGDLTGHDPEIILYASRAATGAGR